MKQMTKEELIEYFMKQLGDNKTLGQVMTIDQIKEKLNKCIIEVTYNPEDFGQGGWGICSVENFDTVLGRINLDIDKLNKTNEDNQEMLIDHEFAHVIGSSVKVINNTIYYKTGFQLWTFVYDSKTDSYVPHSEFNRGINEGMTHILAMNIAGKKEIPGYGDEKNTCTLLSIILGQDELLKIYCDEEIEKYFDINAYDIFKDLAISKYGKELGTKLNEDIRKILALSDQLHILNRNNELDENGLRIQREIREELHQTFLELYERIIDNEPDIIKKIDIIKKCIPTFINEELSKKVLEELVNDDTTDFNKKLEILQQIRAEKKSYIPQSIIENILFSESGLEKLSVEEQLEHYLYLMQGNWGWKDKAYELCVESGRISEELFAKKQLFALSMPFKVPNSEEFHKILREVKYCKIGNYYGLCGNTEDYLFDFQTQKTIWRASLDFNPFENQNIESARDKKFLSEVLPESKTDVLCYHIKDLIKKAEQEGKKYSNKIDVFGNLMRLKYTRDDKELEEYYSIDSNGNLEVVPIRRRT